MPMSLTSLRAQLFKVVDRVIATGVPVEIERNGHKVKIVLDEQPHRLAKLKKRDCIKGDPEDLVDLHVGEWDEGRQV
ncbi:MAG: hypothetical protein QGI68_07445 [Pseudomonadales bacterium]|nr:hypothetical protein [Pseudomonadales bacterium]MDP7359491.1 hypothetical protein [Pseudomonadales bacterium]MDP7595391.1 hypothetical protein [Pseudomonadales bacterium]HJN53005.1 hypothetical protein [Pseudomonadales bacterium]